MKSSHKLIVFLIFLTFIMLLLRVFGVSYFSMSAPKRSGTLSVAAMNDLPAQNGSPMFISFTSATCSICEQMKPALEQFQKEYGNKIMFVNVDTDNPAMAKVTEDFKVEGLPTFFWLTADRKVYDKKIGGWPPDEIKKTMEDLIKENESRK
jgi:thioredoxin-like negative regulator of GroEL